MSSPAIEIWFRADITLKHLQDSSTKTISFTNRPSGEATIRTPNLISISGLGLVAGQKGAPVATSGTIQVRDPYESYAEEMRVFDLLRDYTAIEQAVTVYACQTRVGATDPSTALDSGELWTAIWAGRCASCTKSFDGDDDVLSFDVESEPVEIAFRTRKISSNSGNNPESSAGKSLPIVFGANVLVPAYAARAPSETTQEYEYATSFSTTYETETINRFYCKGEDGRSRLVWSKNATTYWGAGAGVTTGANYSTPQGITEQLCRARLGTVLDYGIVIGGRWRFRGQNNGALTPAGQITFGLYEADPQYYVAAGGYRPQNTAVRVATLDKSNYWTSLQGVNDFWVYFRFEKPYVFGDIPPGTIYNYVRQSPPLFIGMVLSAYAGAGIDFENGGISTTGGEYHIRVGQQGMGPAVTATRPLAELLNLQLDEQGAGTADADGLSASSFLVTIDSAPTAQSNPDLSDLDFVLDIDGIQDDGSGTITGTPNSVITYPHHAMQVLTSSWSGSAWGASSNWDHTAFSSRYSTVFTSSYKWRRTLNGYSSGDSSLNELLADISEEMCGYIIQRTNGKLAWWPWGVENVAAIRVLTDDQIRVLSWTQLDATSVVNKVLLSYGRSVLNPVDSSLFDDNERPNFDGEVNWYNGANAYATSLASQSASLYGTRSMDSRTANWFNDEQSANTLADFILRTYDHPHRTMRIDVPFWENYDLQLLDIIELLSAAAPARSGTCPSARLPTYNGTEIEVIMGNHWRRAQRYRLQIIGREVTFQRGERPTLILDCRVISPYHPNDPT